MNKKEYYKEVVNLLELNGLTRIGKKSDFLFEIKSGSYKLLASYNPDNNHLFISLYTLDVGICSIATQNIHEVDFQIRFQKLRDSYNHLVSIDT